MGTHLVGEGGGEVFLEAELVAEVLAGLGNDLQAESELFGVGLNFLVLAADGRIERDYTFVVA